MKNLNKFFERFYRAGEEESEEKRIKFCLKILKILRKDHLLLVWFPYKGEYNEYDYVARFRSGRSGADFIATLHLDHLEGDYSGDCMRYEFGVVCKIKCVLGHNHYVILGHEIYSIADKRTWTGVIFRGTKLPLRYGYFILDPFIDKGIRGSC